MLEKWLKGVHVGPYMEMIGTYQEMMQYMKDNNLTPAGKSWAEFVDDPGSVKESELRTFIYFPI